MLQEQKRFNIIHSGGEKRDKTCYFSHFKALSDVLELYYGSQGTTIHDSCIRFINGARFSAWMSLGNSCLISKFCPRSEPYLSKYQNTVPRSYTLRQLSNSSFVKIRPWEAAVVEVYLWTTIFSIDHHWKWRNKHSFALYSMSPMMTWGWQPTYTPLWVLKLHFFVYVEFVHAMQALNYIPSHVNTYF